MAILRILHLSDLHARPERDADIQIVIRALFQTLDEIVHRRLWKIDLICFTGDIASRGKAEEYAYAAKIFLDPLLQLVNLDKNALFLVPGNHDVDRSIADADADSGYEKVLAERLIDQQRVNELLDNTSERSRAMSRLKSYGQFAGNYLGGLVNSLDPQCFLTHTRRLHDIEVGIACLNTAWRSSSDLDCKRLLLGERQIDRTVERLGHPLLRIALLHHPLSWLCDFDEKGCERRLLTEFDLVLSGHLHDPQPSVLETPSGRCVFSSTGAIFEGRTLNGFSIIQIDTDSLCGEFLLWRYYDQRRVFDRDLIVASDGRFPFDLVRPEYFRDEYRRGQILRGAGVTIPTNNETLMADTSKRARVADLFQRVQHLCGGPWLLGVALGIMDKGPRARNDGSVEVVDFSLLRLTNSWVDVLLSDLEETGRMVDDESVVTAVIADKIVSFASKIPNYWPSVAEQSVILEFDGVVRSMINPRAVAADVSLVKLNEAELKLAENQFDAALEILQTLEDPTDPKVRACVVEALYGTRRYAEIVGLLSACNPDSLSRSEVEHYIWSLCELGRLGEITKWYKHHTARYQNTAARLFRQVIRRKVSGFPHSKLILGDS